MKKLIDFDGLFDEKLAVYLKENAGKYTEAQWEALIPKLYRKFADTFIPSAGSTPNGYYADLSGEELIETLQAHLRQGVPVSDFLCREIEKRDCPLELLPLITGRDEALAQMALRLANGSEKAISACFETLAGDFEEARKEQARELIRENAERAKELALSFLERGIEREFMLETLSRTRAGDDRVLKALVNAFRTAEENLPIYAGFLAAYGDERALPVLEEYLAREELNYLEYREMRYAAEALGGECKHERDFSNDPYFLEIEKQSAQLSDFSKEEKIKEKK